MKDTRKKDTNELIKKLDFIIKLNSKNGEYKELYLQFGRNREKFLDIGIDYDRYMKDAVEKTLEELDKPYNNEKIEISLIKLDNFSSHNPMVTKKFNEVKIQFEEAKDLTSYLIRKNKNKSTNLTSLIKKEFETLTSNYASLSFDNLSELLEEEHNLINLLPDMIIRLQHFNTLKKGDFFSIHSSLVPRNNPAIQDILQTEHKANSSKIEIFGKFNLKLAFKIIILRCLELGCLFTAFDINEFWFNPLKGLKLWEVSSIEYYGNKIHHILRCDDCYEEVEYYFENFFKSSSTRQESEFICPKCGKHYTYSQLVRIYEKNLAKTYKDNQEEI